jgi:hypothetical protein
VSWSRSNPATRDQSPIYAGRILCLEPAHTFERSRQGNVNTLEQQLACQERSIQLPFGQRRLRQRLIRAPPSRSRYRRASSSRSARRRAPARAAHGSRFPSGGMSVCSHAGFLPCFRVRALVSALESRCRSSVIRSEPGDGLSPARCTGGPAPSVPHALQIGRDTPRSPSSASPSPHRPHGRPSPAARSGSGESLIFQPFVPRQTHPHANPCLLECFNRDTRAQRDVEHDLAGIEEHGQAHAAAKPSRFAAHDEKARGVCQVVGPFDRRSNGGHHNCWSALPAVD